METLAEAAEARAEEEKARAVAAKEKQMAEAAKALLNVPAPTAATQQASGTAATQQASGTSDQRAVTFDVPASPPPVPGRKPTIRQGLNMDLINGKDLKTKVFVIFKEAQGGDDQSKKELSKILTSTM